MMCILKSDAAFHKPFPLIYRISATNAAPQDLNEAVEYISKAPKVLNETSEDLHKPHKLFGNVCIQKPIVSTRSFPLLAL